MTNRPTRRRTLRLIGTLCAGILINLSGCQSFIIGNADKHVYRAIEDRQRDALGATTNVNIGRESGHIGRTDQMYDFTPRPTTPEIPTEFEERQRGNEATRQQGEEETPKSQNAETSKQPANHEISERSGNPGAPGATSPPTPLPGGRGTDNASDQIDNRQSTIDNSTDPAAPAMMSPDIFTAEQLPLVQTFGLADALAYAQRHGREVQDAKETLYLAALDLTLERHLWTPQFAAGLQAEFTDLGQIADFDRAMTAVADVAVAQRLPYGGTVTARMVSTLVRDLNEHATTTGESGNFILEANIPLFRGAGRVAYESRYQAERDLIYAVRTYERFRRSFLVQVASDYFELQQLRSAISNTFTSYKNRRADWEKADFVNRMGQSKNIFEAPRAQSSFRQAEAGLVSAKEQYEASLDRFKIFIGMPVPELLDVLDQNSDADAAALDDLLPKVEVATAIEVALRLRLDLLNNADRIDDARRGVLVAKNQILPDLDATGSVSLDTDSERLNSAGYNTERATWSGLLQLRMDDRKKERNAYRASLIALRKSERDYEVASEIVRADVRRAARRVQQQAKLRDIQAANVEENELRLEAARAQFDLGKITNQDVVDAETDLLSARNDLAAAISAYRVAILDFLRDTETLRVTEDGQWLRPNPHP